MKKALILGLAAIVFLAGFVASISPKTQNYLEILPVNSHTKAICDENNLCQDYHIFCQGKKVVSLTPIGATIQFDKNWNDPRSEEMKDIIC